MGQPLFEYRWSQYLLGFYSGRLVIRGGIDKREVARGRPAIDAELDRVLPTFAETSGYIVCLDHQAHPQIALADYRYYVQRVQSYPTADR